MGVPYDNIKISEFPGVINSYGPRMYYIRMKHAERVKNIKKKKNVSKKQKPPAAPIVPVCVTSGVV